MGRGLILIGTNTNGTKEGITDGEMQFYVIPIQGQLERLFWISWQIMD